MGNIGKIIRHLRKKGGQSQTAFAHAVGVSRVQVHKWETGRDDPSAERITLIAQVLNVSPGELLPGKPLFELPSARVSVSEGVTSVVPDPPDVARIMVKVRTLPGEYRMQAEGYIDGLLAQAARADARRKTRRA